MTAAPEPVKAHITNGRVGQVEYTLCGVEVTWLSEDHRAAVQRNDWCEACMELDA